MADVNYKIGADASAVVKEIGKVRSSLGRLGRMNWANLATGLHSLTAILSTLKYAAVGAFNAVLRPAADVEQYMVRFETMLGSAQKAGEYMAHLREFAASTPFEMNDIAEAAGVLLGFGTSVEKSSSVLRQLGDIAAVSGASLKDLAMIYGKVAAVGLTTEAVNQLSERQVNVRALLAARDGISIAEVQKRLSRQQYGISDLDYVLGATTGAGGIHAGGAAKQAQTLNGILSTFKDNLREIAVTIGSAFAPAIRQMFDKLGEMLPQLQETAEKLAKPVGKILNTLVDNLPMVCKLIEATIKQLEVMATVFDKVSHFTRHVQRSFTRWFGEEAPNARRTRRTRPTPAAQTAEEAALAAQARAAEQAEVARAERALRLEEQLNKARERASAEGSAAAFRRLSAGQQAAELQAALRSYGFTGRVNDIAAVSEFLAQAQGRAASAGDEALFNAFGTLGERFATLRQTSATAAAARRQADTAAARHHIVEGGNTLKLAQFDATQSAYAQAQQYVAAGMGRQEAARLAAMAAAREMNVVQNNPAPSLVAQSRVAVGGGGVALRLGDAQLDIARRHLNVAEESQRIFQDILALFSRNSNTIPVVL